MLLRTVAVKVEFTADNAEFFGQHLEVGQVGQGEAITCIKVTVIGGRESGRVHRNRLTRVQDAAAAKPGLCAQPIKGDGAH